MSKEFNSGNGHGKPKVYQIKVKGYLGPEWLGWFEALNISLEDNGDTLLTFEAADQAALHGLLKKVRDSGITLLSVNPVNTGDTE